MLLVCTAYSWAQAPVEITNAQDIENNTKKLYLIQTNAFPSFYIAPQANTITTNNILGEYMLWYFLDAGTVDDTQYYYIVNNSTGKYIYNHNGNSRGISIISSTDFANLSDENKEKCKFKIVANTNNTFGEGYYNINVKASSQTYYGLNKQNGSQSNATPIRLTNGQYINDFNSKWKFVAFNGTFTYPTPPFTPSTDSEKHYYEIHNIQKNTYYAATDATPDKVIFTNQANESRAWYFKEAASGTWYKYYYIINPATGGKYMYYNGTDTNGNDQQNAVSIKDYDSANEDRYQFVVVQAARGDFESNKDTRVTCYAIIPKLLIDNLWTSSSIGYAQGSIVNGLNMGIINSRSAGNGAHWEFITTTYNTVCATPVISFERTTGKASITTTTLLPSIYYTTDGTTPSSTNGTSYSEPFALTEQTTIKAIVTKDGYTDSDVKTSTIKKVATPTIQQETGTLNVSITTTTPGATIYYTTDGTTPTTSSTPYTGASQDLGGKPIKALAVKDGMINSDIGEGEVDIMCATPVISFDNTTSTVTITCETEGCTIRYTTDNSEPTTTSMAYSGPFSVTGPTTVKAIATHEVLDPSVVTELVIPQVATPIIQDNGSNAVSITTETEGAIIYYTTDGSDPTTASTVYTDPLTDNISGVTIKAIAIKDGMIKSAIAEGSVTLRCANPVFAMSGNGLIISCSFPAIGVTIYYTKNGDDPTISDTPYTGAISVSGGDVIKAIAIATGYSNSSVVTKNIVGTLTPTDGIYYINSQSDFEAFVDMANAQIGADYHYVLQADVTAGTEITEPFTGVFDGGYHTISGLAAPLFTSIDGGTVKNVMFSDVSINTTGNAGAICRVADGETKIYNSGVLSGSVRGSDNVGGLVGLINQGSSVRVVNCYNLGSVSGGSTMAGIVGNNLGTVGNVRIALCMMYGDMAGGTSPVYAGNHVSNAQNFTEYNYWRTKANLSYSVYNDQLAIDKDDYLTRFPFYRHILNSHRELAAWFLFGTSGSDVSSITQDQTDEIGHWALDTDIAPYPIVEAWAKNTKKVIESLDYQDKLLTEMGSNGYLDVSVIIGSNTYTAQLPITDMNEQKYDYTWGKVVLPFANEFKVNNDFSKVCTGWKITDITGGTTGTFENYNVSDRDCTVKDLYSTTGFIFAQGGNYVVPYGVTAIEITANFATAYYLSDESYEIGYSGDNSGNNTSGYIGRTALGGSMPDTYHEQTVYHTLASALNAMSASGSTHNQAVVLVGNYHQDSENLSNYTSKGLTIMSIDADNNQEPDYAWYSNNTQDRPLIPPTRFDFIALIPAGMSSRVNNSSYYPAIPIWKPRGWFEMTETSLSIMGQFELDSNNFNTSDDDTRNYRCIINSGYFTQMVRSRNGSCNKVKYYQIGGNAYIKEFYPGNHSARNHATPLVPINVTGGEIEQCFMTGYGKGTAIGSDIYFWCAGGKIDKFLGAYMEKPRQTSNSDGNVNMTARIDHAKIGRFFGGGTSPNARITGNIDVTINNSTVDFYCGGPEFGDMSNGKTVTTHASNTTFGQFYGAGYGGTAITYTNDEDNTTQGLGDANNPTITYPANFFTNHFVDQRLKYKDNYGIGSCYKFEFIFSSRGNSRVARFYTGYAKFSLATTGSVTNILDGCTVLTDFYGAGCQGKVNGTVTSTLTDCIVNGSAYGGGYKAENNEVEVYPTTPPSMSVYTRETGIFSDFGTVTPQIFTWAQGTDSKKNTAEGNIFYTGTDVTLSELGNVTGAIAITIDGNTTIGEDVYGGGNESKSLNNTTVTLKGDAIINGSVFGGGNKAVVSGSALTLLTDDNSTTGVEVIGSVYGGGNAASVGTTGQSTQATVNISGENARVDGEVYGGCNSEGSVIGKSVVTITAGTVGTAAGQGEPARNVVFGGGKGQPTLIEGNVEVNIGAMSADEPPVPTGSATINGSVYGGSALGNVNASLSGSPAALTPVSGSRTDVNIIGGTINGDAYGGGLGQDLDGTENDIEANVYGDVTVTTLGGSVYDVFGCNNILGTPLKEVTVNIQGGSIVSSVYGGGNLAAYTPTDAQGYLMVNIIDGTVAENVFGGGFGQSATVTANPKVTLTGGTIQGSVFGGGDLAIVSEMVTVDVNGGTVIGDVYGGGALANTNTGYYNLDAGTTSIADGVYTTQVNLHGGTVTGNVYGGGLGQIGGTDIADVKAYVGSTRIELNPGVQDTCVVQGNIFGCNNLNGTPTGGVLVHIYKTQGWAGHDVSDYKNVDDAPKDNSVYELAAVYGGGNLADYIPIGTDTATCVIIDGCGETSIRKVYGGGNAASTPATNVTVHGTYEIAELFGGGNGKDQINVNGTIKDNPGAHVGYKAYPDDAVDKTDYIYGTGRSNVTIYGGTIHAVYGGSDTKGNVRHQAVMLLDAAYNVGDPSYCPFDVDHTYGGGKNAPMDGQVIMKLECIPGLNTIYGGAENADVNGDVVLNITNGQYRQVFGGNNIGGQVNGAITINIEETGCQPIIIGELYGGGRKAPYSVYGYKFEGTGDDKVLKPRTSMQDDGTGPATPFDDPTINIKSFTSIGNVYGGGLGVEAEMVGNPHVNINVGYGAYNNDDIGVYAGDTMQVENIDGATADVILPAHKKGDIGSINTVYGGGNAANVIGDTYVYIGTEAQVHLESTGQDIPVQGAIIEDNVYGGGNQADVTGSTHIQVGHDTGI